MPGYTDVCVWIQSDKHEALKKALAERNLKLEDQLQEKLEEIYSEYVPQMQREDIAAKIEAEIRQEQEEAALRAAERYRESVLKVIGAGYVRCWKIGAALSDLHIARLLRKALRDPASDHALVFDELLGEKAKIKPEEFARVACMVLQEEKPAANAVTLDFDKEYITLAEPKHGYLTYHMKDVSTAIYQAQRAAGLLEQQIADRFHQRLAGKTVHFAPMTNCVPQDTVSLV